MDKNLIPNKFITPVAILLFVVGAVYLGVLTWNAVKAHDYIGVSEEQRHTISFQGSGDVTATPDIARVTLGHSVTEENVADAQENNSEKINNVISKLKDDFGIEDKDVKTANYSIRPQYDYIEGERQLRGYEVSQDVEVKIRDLDRIKDILGFAGEVELNQVGNLSFDIDDKEELKEQARQEAIEEARKKADSLTDTLGVNLGKIVNFSEGYQSDQPQPVYKEEEALGRGGADTAPDVESGSQEVKVNVSLTYEIL
ncbi:MAG: SIMPL domain-containing protein [Patescibacteria group bacterium]